jgi:hypothetical protein
MIVSAAGLQLYSSMLVPYIACRLQGLHSQQDCQQLPHTVTAAQREHCKARYTRTNPGSNSSSSSSNSS